MTQGRSFTARLAWPSALRLNPRALLVLLLLAGCLASALAVIAISHLTREEYAALQQLEREQQQLQTEWGQLLLEESAWSSPARIERLAVERLEMRLPGVDEVEVIRR
ncbi:cell division protein FtsL [Halomonas sp. G15]|uniref:Cell division protein FtsL n=1 Tax=Halomonas alimentaria TaxID=147248 RepID=A0A7X4W8U0_9GAMM|nr:MULTISPECIES: cell division protein FtsL [Halomonas]MCE0731409.1 cell division protein FtsL [Halomonas sp. G15]NAW35156.1 cell division protein FtsL [Halomonas alimentaria]